MLGLEFLLSSSNYLKQKFSKLTRFKIFIISYKIVHATLSNYNDAVDNIIMVSQKKILQKYLLNPIILTILSQWTNRRGPHNWL